MTRLQFCVLMMFILSADWMFQHFAPGIFWFAPAALIGAMVADPHVEQNSIMFGMVALVIDLVSGIPFGWVTLVCFALLGLIIILRRWIRMTDMRPLFFGIYAISMTAIFASMLTYPLELLTIVSHLPMFVLQSLAPLMMIITIHQSPRTKSYGIT